MDIKRQLIKTARDLAAAGLVSGISGNLSIKNVDNIIITTSGSNLAHLTGHDIARVGFDGSYSGSAKPSVELDLHLAIYKKRPDVKAVVHTHSVFATVLACLKENLMEVNPEAGEFSNVKVCSFKPHGTPELAEKAAKNLGENPAVILERHGVVCVGSSLMEAEKRALALEEVAKITYFIKLYQK